MITQLNKIYEELSELTDEDLVMEYSDQLTTINESFNDNTSDEEFNLMNLCEDMMEVAKDHFERIHHQEELEQELDERKYEGARHLS